MGEANRPTAAIANRGALLCYAGEMQPAFIPVWIRPQIDVYGVLAFLDGFVERRISESVVLTSFPWLRGYPRCLSLRFAVALGI